MSKVNSNTTGLIVEGHIGTWYTIDRRSIRGKSFYLLEHEIYGEDALAIIVDSEGKLILDEISDGFDHEIIERIIEKIDKSYIANEADRRAEIWDFR